MFNTNLSWEGRERKERGRLREERKTERERGLQNRRRKSNINERYRHEEERAPRRKREANTHTHTHTQRLTLYESLGSRRNPKMDLGVSYFDFKKLGPHHLCGRDPTITQAFSVKMSYPYPHFRVYTKMAEAQTQVPPFHAIPRAPCMACWFAACFFAPVPHGLAVEDLRVGLEVNPQGDCDDLTKWHKCYTPTWKASSPIIWGYFVPIMSYLGVWWPLHFGLLGVPGTWNASGR